MPAHSAKRSRPRRRQPRSRWIPRAVWLHGALLATLVVAGYVLWIDRQIQATFAHWRWELPARVYARPLELYAGLEMERQQLEEELHRLGYQSVAALTGVGQYVVKSNEIAVHTRGFAFWDTHEPPSRIAVRFAGKHVSSMESIPSRRALPLMRLEPMQIARIYPNHHEDRVLVQLREVPSTLIDALLAIEDRRYYQHSGIDLIAIARAAYTNLKGGRIQQGGSTLTQQLVKNFYLGRQRTVWRKLNEMAMAVSLERHYTKEQILEAYLNEIYLGQDGQRAIHGFGLAAEFYFGRPLNELRLHEQALLVGLAKGASYYDPRRYPERARERRNLVLATMEETGKLTEAAATQAKQAHLTVTERPLFRSQRYPAFVDLVRRQVRQDYRDEDLRTEGLQIFTTLDPALQSKAEAAVTKQLGVLEKSNPRQRGHLQTALIVTNHQNGEVLAMLGDRNPHYAGFNRALDARRPVGSLLKPAVYLAALEHPDRYTVTTTLDDEPITLQSGGKKWTPSNYDGFAHGAVSLREALAHSYNLATVRLGTSVGIPAVRSTLRELGIESELPEYPSLFLGAVDLSPLEITQMYQTIAAKGFRTPLRAIRDVLTRDGQRLTRYELKTEPAADQDAVYLLTYLLTKVTSEGTAAGLSHWLGDDHTVAGKTGTTNELRDSWFAGFSEDLTAVVWMGRDDNAPIRLTGAQGAMRIWGELMASAEAKPLRLETPAGIEWRWVDQASGIFSQANCPGTHATPFIRPAPAAPIEPCTSNTGTILEIFGATTN